MPSRDVLENLKQATVALAVMHESQGPSREPPFTIVGSGFCVHHEGVVVTCAHVVEAFMEKKIREQLEAIPESERGKTIRAIGEVRSHIPRALFYIPQPKTQEVVVACVGVRMVLVKTNCSADLAVLRLSKHDAFRNGFPRVEIAAFEDIADGAEIATCGFPLGNTLFSELGTVSSSLTRGIVSAVIPTAGPARAHVTGFQLDLKSTHGNSGGPVFLWETGKVFGALQSGISDRYGNHLFTRAKSIYPIFDTGMIDQVLRPPAMSVGVA